MQHIKLSDVVVGNISFCFSLLFYYVTYTLTCTYRLKLFCVFANLDWPPRHNVIDISVRLSVRPSVTTLVTGNNILKANEPILMQIGTSGRWDKGIQL